jgi:hypothetical protein
MPSCADWLRDSVNSCPPIASLLVALLLFGVLACGDRFASPAVHSPVAVEMRLIQVDKRNPGRIDFDRLALLASYQLRSGHSYFGGLSGLAIGSDGSLYAVSDRGAWVTARMRLDARGRLSNLTDWQIAPLLAPDGTAVRDKMMIDAEGLARAPDGQFIVSFEQAHRLWRYGAPPGTLSSAAVPLTLPREIRKAPRNGGIEAVAALPDGRILTFAEDLNNADGTVKAWLIDTNNSAPLSYSPERDFVVSDATALKNGDVIVLERRYTPLLHFATRLTLVDSAQIRPGAVLKGDELLRLETPLLTANFEGVAVMENDAGTIIFLVSDDNYMVLQRTLLLQFLLPAQAIPSH